ncbi:hypothetical protein V6N13_012926 [Hibiscus sabdariffa]
MLEQNSWERAKSGLQITKPPPWKYSTRGSLLGGGCLGRKSRAQVLFGGLIGMSLERTRGLEMSGGVVTKALASRVNVPSGFKLL